MFLDEALSNLIALHPCSSHADGIALTILVSRHCVIAADVSGDLGVLSVCLSVCLSVSHAFQILGSDCFCFCVLSCRLQGF